MVATHDERARSFNAVGALYEEFRPGYSDQFFADVAAEAGLNEGDQVLEIGCGPGVATEGLLRLGLDVWALEPGPALAQRTRERFAGSSLHVETATFEEWARRGHSYRAVIAASSFHWVDPAERWRLAQQALEPGGTLVLMAHRMVKDGSFSLFLDRVAPELSAVGIGDAHHGVVTASELRARLHDSIDVTSAWTQLGRLMGAEAAPEFFFEPRVVTEAWSATYSAEEAVQLLATYSAYITLTDAVRHALLERFRQIIFEEYGGRLERHYFSVAVIADRR